MKTQTPIPPVDLAAERAELGHVLDEVVLEVLHSGGYVLGPKVAAFEEAFATYQRAGFGVGVGSGTDALILGLKALGIGPGDGVLTTPFTFFASAGAIAWIGAKPQLVDVDPRTGLIDVEQARAAVDDTTRCLLPVHIYGQLADMRALRALADERGLKLLEDAAQAHGAERDGLRAGEVGDAAAFSFYPTKNLGAAGEGGMVLSNDKEVDAHLRRLRDHGSPAKYEHAEIGTNSRLQAMQAAVLGTKLPHLDAWNARRREVARAYDDAFADCAQLEPLEVEETSVHARHQYGLRVKGAGLRDKVLAGLQAEKIFAAIHYPKPVHLQPAAASWGYSAGAFPASEKLAEEILCLPIHPFLGAEDLQRVVEGTRKLASD